MSSLNKMLSLLDLFTPSAPVWSTDDLIRFSGSSRSTCYRYIKALQYAGLISPVGSSSYILGPRIMEFDRQIRLCDPVYTAGGSTMEKLSEETKCSSVLCVLFSDMVMCVRDVLRPDAPRELFSRGQKRPLFAGAASKIILAYIPPHQLRRLYRKHRKTVAASGLGADWNAFRESLRVIRENKYCITRGEFNPGITGVAAPLFNKDGKVLGSIGIAAYSVRMSDNKWLKMAPRVVAAAAEITRRISTANFDADLAARAVGKAA
jgi:DNA-binding IclR family transcriptional regulator